VSTGDDGRRRHMDRMEVRVKKVGEDWVWGGKGKNGMVPGERTRGEADARTPAKRHTKFSRNLILFRSRDRDDVNNQRCKIMVQC
jgi:hypothetical protein